MSASNVAAGLQRRWRSLLFVPADNARVIAKAHQRGADALIIDLEDAVAVDTKAAARAGLTEAAAGLADRGADVLVRINADPAMVSDDLAAAVRPAIGAIVVPKVADAADLVAIGDTIGRFESERDLPVGRIGLVALIESADALFRLPDIAHAPRMIALAFGSEDFSFSLGVPPTPACLTLPCQMIALAASAAGRMSFGLPTSLANFRDLAVLRTAALDARAMGLTGALCIHPDQVRVVNDAFAPSASEIAWARSVVDVWQKARAGVATLDGGMIDRPVVERARAVLALVGDEPRDARSQP
jgi:citrate lyase subunit beta/citryl-CoA lyase